MDVFQKAKEYFKLHPDNCYREVNENHDLLYAVWDDGDFRERKYDEKNQLIFEKVFYPPDYIQFINIIIK